MTEFNKGDIVYPTAEFQENRAALLADAAAYSLGLDPEEAEKSRVSDTYLADGKPLRIVATGTEVLPGFQTLYAVRTDDDRTDLDLQEFKENWDSPEYDDLFFVFSSEVQHEGGVLAGV